MKPSSTSSGKTPPFKANLEPYIEMREGIPTSTGGVIDLREAMDARADLRIETVYEAEEGGEESTILRAKLLLPDDKGDVWALESTFTPEVFLTYMFDLSSIDMIGLMSKAKAPKTLLKDFKKNTLISGAQTLLDDRFYRKLLIDDALFSVQFKYTLATFDVALENMEEVNSSLIVRVREGSFWGGPYRTDSDEDEDEEFEDLGELYFKMEWAHLFRHNSAVYDEEEESWIAQTFGRPLCFVPTGLKAEAQEEVKFKGKKQ